MNENELKKAFEQYEPTEEQCRAIERRVRARGMMKTRERGRVWRADVAIGAACLAVAAGLIVFGPGQTVKAPSDPVSASEATQSQVQILALSAGQEEEPQALQIGVEMPLGAYRLESSMVPGFPFIFQWENGGQSAEVSVSQGSLLRWDRQTGQVTDAGKKTNCKNGETLYYAPPEGGSLTERDSLTICIADERQSVLIWSQEGTYFAKILPEEQQS